MESFEGVATRSRRKVFSLRLHPLLLREITTYEETALDGEPAGWLAGFKAGWLGGIRLAVCHRCDHLPGDQVQGKAKVAAGSGPLT